MALLTTAARKRRERRKQLFFGLLKVSIAVGLLAFTAFSAFEVGASKTRTQKERLENELVDFRERDRERVREDAAAKDEVERLRQALAQVESDYAANVPTGEKKQLLDLVGTRLETGVPAERLAFVIREAAAQRQCAPDIEAKRLQARTPIVGNAANTVGFADNLVTVSGEGASARDEAGRPEAWFDPGQPVTLRFQTIGGESVVVEEVLPVTHAMVINGDEYLFQATPAERRGFVEIAVQVCEFP
ncbi:MAG: hypothetical protein R3C97_15565 [Geminicoccaceae bacterium]